jgi:hypothetical protein
MRSATSAGRRRVNGGTGIGSGIGLTLSVGGSCARTGRREETWHPVTDTQLLQTRPVPTFTLYVALRAEAPLDDAVVAAVAGVLRPEDEWLCIWRDEDDGALLRVSVDGVADDLEAALDLGRDLAEETAAASPLPTEIEEVVAMDDERQVVWRAKP